MTRVKTAYCGLCSKTVEIVFGYRCIQCGARIATEQEEKQK